MDLLNEKKLATIGSQIIFKPQIWKRHFTRNIIVIMLYLQSKALAKKPQAIAVFLNLKPLKQIVVLLSVKKQPLLNSHQKTIGFFTGWFAMSCDTDAGKAMFNRAI